MHAVVLHGLGRSSLSMERVSRLLQSNGYRVLNLDYPSRSADIWTLAKLVAERIDDWNHDAPLDFVTHSLGGILLRAAVAGGHLPLDRIRRAVMLGPPNTGSELADVLPTWPVVGAAYRRFTGPAGLQLGTSLDDVPPSLPPVEFEVGIIAGTRSVNPIFAAILRDASDGKVRVERTRVAGMTDFLEVACWHPLLPVATSLQPQILHFLKHGRFLRSSSELREV